MFWFELPPESPMACFCADECVALICEAIIPRLRWKVSPVYFGCLLNPCALWTNDL